MLRDRRIRNVHLLPCALLFDDAVCARARARACVCGVGGWVGCVGVWVCVCVCVCVGGGSQTAVAVGRTILVLIVRRDFTRLVAKLIQDKTQARLNVLQKQHYAFASWSTERLIKLSNFLVPFVFARGTVIASQSADIKHIFIVSDGAVRVATDVRVDDNDKSTHKAQPPLPQQLHSPPSSHPIHSPRPGKTLMDSRKDASGTVQLALLGPGSVIGEVELAVGRRQYQSTFIASCVLLNARCRSLSINPAAGCRCVWTTDAFCLAALLPMLTQD